MKICSTIHEVNNFLSSFKESGKKIGFVPTMGALHQGHLSLVQRSKSDCGCTVVSIFVNPTQFNDKEDYLLYPRNVDVDLELLKSNHCDMVFLPTVEEIYPEPDQRTFNFGHLESIMEGKYRPGHFQGVAKVVSKLFDIVKPDKAYFGIKDFQQLAIIKKLAEIEKYKIEIIGCPILREKNGLAMSSRNERLSLDEFDNASIIYKTLSRIPEMLSEKSLKETKDYFVQTIDTKDGFKVEYIEFVDTESLFLITDEIRTKSVTCCVAVFCGKVRLIDNIQIFL